MDEINACLDSPDDYTIHPETGRFVCNNCQNGLTWEFEEEGVEYPWQCNVCDVVYENCVLCTDNKCQACSPGPLGTLIPNFDGQSCVSPLAHCLD